MYFLQIILIFFLAIPTINTAEDKRLTEDQIIGKWMSTEQNLIVHVYKNGDQFKAKIIWFDDADDSSKPMNVRLDEHNPIHSLRARKILGLDVLKDLKFNAIEKRWEDGVIYDPKSGRHWSSVVYFNNNGLLEVKGYWKFEFLCKTITFKKVN